MMYIFCIIILVSNKKLLTYSLHCNTFYERLDFIFICLPPGSITASLFSDWNIKKFLSYMVFLKTSSPRHKFRFSDTAWLRQGKSADHILRRLHERYVCKTRFRSFLESFHNFARRSDNLKMRPAVKLCEAMLCSLSLI